MTQMSTQFPLLSFHTICCGDLVDIVEDEDDGDAGLDVSHVHFAKEALSGRRLLMILGDHLMILLQGS